MTIIYSAHTKHQVNGLSKNQCVLFLKNIPRGGKRNAKYQQCTRNIDGCCGTGS
jgi:hypothetical protein